MFMSVRQLNITDHADGILQRQDQSKGQLRQGDDRRTFTNPTKSCNSFAEAMVKGTIVQFEEGAPVYVRTDMQGSEGRAALLGLGANECTCSGGSKNVR